MLDLIGKRFNRLTVIEETRNKQDHRAWKCLCDCGNMITATTGNLRGSTKSCGCLKKENDKKRFYVHGKRFTPEYHVWLDMRDRCLNPKNYDYKDYGGRGITVCTKWNDFQKFIADMGERPIGLTIERLDNSVGYFPENCKWVTRAKQSQNKRTQRNNKSGVAGVYLRSNNKYRVYISVERKRINLGTFIDLADAICVRKKAERTYWGKL